MNNYDDIINLPHHVSSNHPQMSIYDRAAQFSPFAALTGHDAAIKETARITDQRIDLDDSTKQLLDERLQFLRKNLTHHPEVSITYFVPDQKKEGGGYVTVTGSVSKMKEYEQLILLENGEQIPLQEIISVDGKLFKVMDETI